MSQEKPITHKTNTAPKPTEYKQATETMQLSSRNIENNCHNFYFDNGTWVGITPDDETWEYQDGDDEETYMSGCFILDENTVIDYDGCYELPKEVVLALAMEYNIDL